MHRRILLFMFSLLLLLSLGGCIPGLGGEDGWIWGDAEEEVSEVVETPDGSEDEGAQPIDTVASGEICSSSNECQDDEVCLPYGQESRCSATCDTSAPYCDDGAHCVALQDLDFGACASWGTGGLDALCEGKLDCQRSLACFTDTQGDGRCEYTCDFSEEVSPCPAGWSCTITTAGLDFGRCVEN